MINKNNMSVVLTKGQKLTLDRLGKEDYTSIKQADITRLLGKMLDQKGTAEDVIPKVMSYEKFVYPKKSVDDIQKILSKKIKDKGDREMFRDVLKLGDYSSFPDTDKVKKGKQPIMFDEQLPSKSSGKQTKSNGSSSEFDSLIDRLLASNDGSVEKKQDTPTQNPFSGSGRSLDGGGIVPSKPSSSSGSVDFSNFFKTGSSAFRDPANKQIIDELKEAISKESLSDGSWFTKIGSFEIPELAIIQKIVDFTPLGFSETDKTNFDKFLSNDPVQMNSLSTAQSLKLIGKMLVNPDAVGKLITTRASQYTADVTEGLEKIFNKMTGQKEEKSEEIGSLEDIIKSRRSKDSKTDQRRKDLDRLNGIKPKEPDKYNGDLRT
jgi:hypothetical protein